MVVLLLVSLQNHKSWGTLTKEKTAHIFLTWAVPSFREYLLALNYRCGRSSIFACAERGQGMPSGSLGLYPGAMVSKCLLSPPSR